MSKFKGLCGMGTLFMLMVILALGASFIGYQVADHIYYEQIAGIVGKAYIEEPGSEVIIAKSLKQAGEGEIAEGKKILNRYGYSEDFLELGSNKRGFVAIVRANMVLVLGIFLIIVGMGYRAYSVLKKKLDGLLGYLEQLAKGNYKIDIENVGEGKFSLFEDEIYKTTVALREGKEEQEIEKLNLARNIADISHQLKTPLSSMGIMTDILLDNEENEQNKLFIKKLICQIDRLSHLVGVLLKLAKFDAGTVKLKAQEVNVGQLLEEIAQMLEVPIKQKALSVRMEGAEDICFIGDEGWTYEALLNVLNNAIQYSKVEGEIRVKWRQNPIYTEVIIQDGGGGIAKEDLPHIFTRFYHGKNAGKESIGIGLAMAKLIIEKQNGEIKVYSTENGAKFVIKFYHVT